MVAKRKTTVAHMFASAIAPVDHYSEADVVAGLAMLGQTDALDVRCVYCDEPAETWDHLRALVLDSQFSGHGHQLGNLVPSCKRCNSQKGNKDYREFLRHSGREDAEQRIEAITRYSQHFLPHPLPQGEYARLWPQEMAALKALQEQVVDLMRQADGIALDLRKKAAAVSVGSNKLPG